MSTQASESSYYSTFAKHDFTEIDENVDKAAKKAAFVYDKIFLNPTSANCISDNTLVKPSESIIQDKSTISSSNLDEAKIFALLLVKTSDVINHIIPSDTYGSEAYRQMRRLYDVLQSFIKRSVNAPSKSSHIEINQYDYTEYVEIVFEPLMKFITASHLYITRFNRFIFELNKSTEEYKSVYLRDISEEELWETRCKAYTYRI